MEDTFNLKFELEAWSHVNKLLRQQGLPAIEISTPDTTHFLDGVLFGAELNQRLRGNLQSLMQDVNRRQALVQELIQTNNQLREELTAQTGVSESYESRTRDLRAMLDSSRSKVEALELEMQESSQCKDTMDERARNTNAEIKIHTKQLQQRCRNYEAEIERLKIKVKRMVEEDEQRLKKQSHVFQDLRKKTSRGLDDKVLDVIDSYEKQIYELQQDLDSYKTNNARSSGAADVKSSGTSQYKALIRAFEKEIRDGKKRQKELENDVNLLQLELQGRPELKDLRVCQTKLKKLERIVKRHDLMGAEERFDKIEKKKYSTQVDDIDYLPVPHCRSYLKIICNHVGVFDLEHVSPKLEKNAKAAEAFPRLEQFAKQVLDVVDTEGVTKPPGARVSNSSHEMWCERSWHHAVPTLQHWLTQLKDLKELQASINKLSNLLLPWRKIKLTEATPTVTQMVAAVDAIIYEEETEDSSKPTKRAEPTKEQASRTMLQGIVEHFMHIFDVTKITGCYARMNDVYTKLGETHNVLKTLRDLLALGKESKSTLIVDSVARLCELQNASAHAQLQQLLLDDDVESITRKIKLYDEFFPVFHDIMTKLMDVTGVSRIDQVVPAVRALKILLDSR